MGSRLILERIKEFKNSYEAELSFKCQSFKEVYGRLIEFIGIEMISQRIMEKEEEFLQPLLSLNGLPDKIYKLNNLKMHLENEILQLTTNSEIAYKTYHHISTCPNNYNCLEELQKYHNDLRAHKNELLVRLEELLEFLNLINSQILAQLSSLEEKIKKSRGRENAYVFQDAVIEILSWLCIDEIKLLQTKESDEFRLRRDGVFEVKDNFYYIGNRNNFINFSHIIVECKNIIELKYKHLMQVYAYTLLNKVTPFFRSPLCLIVTRIKPSEDNIIYKMRNKLLEGNQDKGPMLTLFLSIEDISQMIISRKNDCDPFLILIEQLNQIRRQWQVPE